MKYSNGDSLIKDNVRQLLSAELISDRKIIRVLSLPADNFLFEKSLEDMYPDKTFVFTCLEKDTTVYQRGLQNLKNLRSKVDYLNMSTFDLFSQRYCRIKYDIIWLDYCGMFSDYVIFDLQFCKNIIHDKSVVAVTLMGCREHRSRLTCLDLPEDVEMKEVREYYIPKHLSNITSIPIKKVIHYCDKTKKTRSAPMYLYILADNVLEKVPVIRLEARIAYTYRA